MQRNTHLRDLICSLTLYLLLLLPVKSSDVESFDSELSDLTDTVAAAIDKAELKSITVADFTDLRGEVSQLGRFLADEVSTGLVLDQKKFIIVDRANLKRIMDEHKLTMSGLVQDPENAKKLGQLAGVDAIVIGTLTPLTNSVRVTIKVLATDSAKLVGAARGNLSKTGSIQQLMRGGGDSGELTKAQEAQKSGDLGVISQPGELKSEKGTFRVVLPAGWSRPSKWDQIPKTKWLPEDRLVAIYPTEFKIVVSIQRFSKARKIMTLEELSHMGQWSGARAAAADPLLRMVGQMPALLWRFEENSEMSFHHVVIAAETSENYYCIDGWGRPAEFLAKHVDEIVTLASSLAEL